MLPLTLFYNIVISDPLFILNVSSWSSVLVFFNKNETGSTKVKTNFKGSGCRSPFSVALFLSMYVTNFCFAILQVLLKEMSFSRLVLGYLKHKQIELFICVHDHSLMRRIVKAGL